jgi:hypothetical protein
VIGAALAALLKVRDRDLALDFAVAGRAGV